MDQDFEDEYDSIQSTPTMMVMDKKEDANKKVIDFDLGDQISVILTGN